MTLKHSTIDDRNAYGFKQVQRMLEQGDMEKLDWKNENVLGETIHVQFPNPATDLVIARSGVRNARRYEVFAAAELPHATLSTDAHATLRTAQLIESYYLERQQDGLPASLNDGALQDLLENVALSVENVRDIIRDTTTTATLHLPQRSWIDTIKLSRQEAASERDPGQAGRTTP